MTEKLLGSAKQSRAHDEDDDDDDDDRDERRATCEEEECGGEGEEEEEGFATRATTTAGAMIDVRQMSAKRAVEVAMKRRGRERRRLRG